MAKRRAVRGAGFILAPLDQRKKAEIGWRRDISRFGMGYPRKIRLQTDVEARTRGTKPGEKGCALIQSDSDAKLKTPATFISHWKQARSDTGTAAWKDCWNLILAD